MSYNTITVNTLNASGASRDLFIYIDDTIDLSNISVIEKSVVIANNRTLSSATSIHFIELANTDTTYDFTNERSNWFIYVTIPQATLTTLQGTITGGSWNNVYNWYGTTQSVDYNNDSGATQTYTYNGNAYTCYAYGTISAAGAYSQSIAIQASMNMYLAPSGNITITQTIQNGTSTIQNGAYAIGTFVSGQVTPNVGYLCDTVSANTRDYGNITVNASPNYYNVYFICLPFNNTIVYSFVADPDFQTINVTQNLTNCTSDYSSATAVQGNAYTITLTPTTGYYFADSSDITATYGTVSVAQDGSYATIQFTATSSDITIAATATAIPAPATINVIQTLTDCTSDYTSATAVVGNVYTITITANHNYYFPSSANITANYGIVTVAQDGSYVTIGFTATTTDLTIDAIAVVSPSAYIGVIQNCTNCTSDYTSLTAYVGHSYTIIYTANAGYTFQSGDVTATYGTISIAQDGSYATLQFTATTSNITIDASPSIYQQTITVTQNLTNCTSDYTSITGVVGQSFTITLTATQDGNLDQTMRVRTCTATYGTITYLDDRRTVEITGTFTSSNLTITANAERGYKIVLGTLQNCTVTPSVGTILWANDNNSVRVDGVDSDIRFYDSDGRHTQSYLMLYCTAGTTRYFMLSASNDNLYAEITNLQIPYVYGNHSTIYIKAYGYSITPTGRLLSDIRAYMLYCYDGLYDVSTSMQTITEIMQSSTHQPGVIQFYISHITPTISAYSQAITVMGHSLNATALIPYIEEYSKEVDCGTVTLTRKYNNAIDYNAKVQIYLPFIGLQTLDTSRVIGKTISLIYRADFITGQCLAVLYIDGLLVDQYKGQFIEKFQTRDRDSTLGSLDYDISLLYDLTPYILVEDVDIITSYKHETYAYGRIGTFTGFNRFDNIKLVCNCATVIYDDIIAQLKEGVIIRNSS